MHAETYEAMQKANSGAMWWRVAGAQSEFATARSRRHRVETRDFFMCQMWCSSSSAGAFSKQRSRFHLLIEINVAVDNSVQSLNLWIIKAEEQRCPIAFWILIFQTDIEPRVASLLNLRWINTTRGAWASSEGAGWWYDVFFSSSMFICLRASAPAVYSPFQWRRELLFSRVYSSAPCTRGLDASEGRF